MLKKLYVKNYAIIDQLEISFSDHLTIITGETGAGKSILLGALSLIMGKRADTKSLHIDSQKCIIEGTFDLSKYKLQPFFDLHDIDYDIETVIRREITPSGKSRAFVNDTPTNLKVVQQLTASLIDLHQQFDTRDMNNVSFQLRMIDALAGNGELIEAYRKDFSTYKSDLRTLDQLVEQARTANNEMDFLNFQLEELENAQLEAGNEQVKLEEEQAMLTNAEKIKATLGAAFRQISDSETAVVGQLETFAFQIAQIKDYHPKLSKVHQRYEGVIEELKDVTAEFENIAEETEHNGERIEEVQSRLDLIYRLQKKHGVQHIDELISIQSSISEKLKAYTDLSSDIEKLQQEINQQLTILEQKAEILSANRKKVVLPFEQKIHTMLKQLGMEYAQIKVEIVDASSLSATGKDFVEFLFSPNKGSKFLPIKEVASGGELSRLTLCIKSLVASAIPLPTLIFDEIDTGISGDVALKMGNILKSLSDEHQVVSITHTPQIAIQAHTHYFVYKEHTTDRTITNVKLLNQLERVQEVATMLSGSPPSTAAIKNAKELLGM